MSGVIKKLVIGIFLNLLASFCFLVLAVFAVSFIAERGYMKQVRPEGVTHISEFISRFPSRIGVYRVDYAGQQHVLVLTRPPSAGLALPSGPPAYVFDSNGRLVTWSADTGDDPEFSRTWPTGSSNQMSADAFHSYVEQCKSQHRTSPP